MNVAITKAISITGSQTELARRVGVSQSTVCKWFHNKSGISSIQHIAAIVRATKGAVTAAEIDPTLADLIPLLLTPPELKSTGDEGSEKTTPIL